MTRGAGKARLAAQAQRRDAGPVDRHAPTPTPAAGAPGFTLLEVLVAFVIAAMALSVLFEAGLDGVRGATLSGRTQEALARAQSHLAALGEAPAAGDRQGDEGDGFHWHVRVVPLATAQLPGVHRFGSAGAPPQRLSLLSVAVAVSWAPLHSVELQTERVVQGAVAAP